MQLTQSDLEALDDRLRNWGRWAADRPAVGSSYLWRAMKKYGKDDETEGDDEQDSKPPKVDVLDALFGRACLGVFGREPVHVPPSEVDPKGSLLPSKAIAREDGQEAQVPAS